MSHFLRPLLSGPPSDPALVNERTGEVVADAVETAFDSRTRRQGLLGRDDLAEGAALVLAPCNAVHTVRMRFPIDVVFVARDGRVTKIVERLAAWRAAASLSAFATIELRAGEASRRGVRVGDRILVERGLSRATNQSAARACPPRPATRTHRRPDSKSGDAAI